MYLKDFREHLGLSQKELAEQIGLTQVTIARYETNKMSPNSNVIEKYIDIFKANPNYLFLGKEPKKIDFETSYLSDANYALLEDLNLFLSQNELNSKLKAIFIEQVLQKFEGNKETSPLVKILKSLNLEGHIPYRPLLFLYYVFMYISNNESKITPKASYKKYFIGLVKRYKTFSIKNNAAFTETIKQEFEANIELNLTEEECKLIITHPQETLNKIESKMSSKIILAHRKVDVDKLFQKTE